MESKTLDIIEKVAAVAVAIWVAIIACTRWWEFILTIPLAAYAYWEMIENFTSTGGKIFGMIACAAVMRCLGIYVAAFWLWVVGAIFSVIGWCISSGMGIIGTVITLFLIWGIIKWLTK